MITTELTGEMIAGMKRLCKAHRPALRPNRKSGAEVDGYFRSKYPCQLLDDRAFRAVVAANIMENAHSRAKLRDGTWPDIRCYRAGDVLVGIDLVSGEFHVEAENIAKAVPIYDDLFAFRGLDEEDLKNFVLVAEYVKLLQENAVKDGNVLDMALYALIKDKKEN